MAIRSRRTIHGPRTALDWVRLTAPLLIVSSMKVAGEGVRVKELNGTYFCQGKALLSTVLTLLLYFTTPTPLHSIHNPPNPPSSPHN